MRNLLKFASCAAALATIAGYAIAGDEAELPLRKAGVWELKTVMDEGMGPRGQTFKMCIDGDMERQTARSSVVEHQENCSTYEIKKESAGTTVNADCVYSQASVQSRTEMSGDFQTTFQIKIESTTVPMKAAQSKPVKRTITQSGSYVGADCGDLKPGEAQTADGSKMLVQ